ncbi:hypothetical protein EYF80_027801 [Liparis tanakae]|uniref:Uncharacterized protein n=1 Tax=Liparis tanakae TaxID=230148 RepID=A0A4Z2H861_9TELE|nr:hypothetical protein EYF80_027801 [Liparis tanakae]
MAGDYFLCTRSSSHSLQHKLQNLLSVGLRRHAHGPLVVARLLISAVEAIYKPLYGSRVPGTVGLCSRRESEFWVI